MDNVDITQIIHNFADLIFGRNSENFGTEGIETLSFPGHMRSIPSYFPMSDSTKNNGSKSICIPLQYTAYNQTYSSYIGYWKRCKQLHPRSWLSLANV